MCLHPHHVEIVWHSANFCDFAISHAADRTHPEGELLCHRVLTHSEQVHILVDILEEYLNEGRSQRWRLDRFDEMLVIGDSLRRVPICNSPLPCHPWLRARAYLHASMQEGACASTCKCILMSVRMHTGIQASVETQTHSPCTVVYLCILRVCCRYECMNADVCIASAPRRHGTLDCLRGDNPIRLGAVAKTITRKVFLSSERDNKPWNKCLRHPRPVFEVCERTNQFSTVLCDAIFMGVHAC
jgi:hypothetical protein